MSVHDAEIPVGGHSVDQRLDQEAQLHPSLSLSLSLSLSHTHTHSHFVPKSLVVSDLRDHFTLEAEIVVEL